MAYAQAVADQLFDVKAYERRSREGPCEVARAGIERPALLALTKFDDADLGAIVRFGKAFPGLPVVTTCQW
jgi:hypothetical protein